MKLEVVDTFECCASKAIETQLKLADHEHFVDLEYFVCLESDSNNSDNFVDKDQFIHNFKCLITVKKLKEW